MTVEVVHLQGGTGGAIPVTSFSDSFNRADEPPFFGNLWLPLFHQSATNNGTNVATNVNVSGAHLICGGVPLTAAGVIVGIPVQLTRDAVIFKAQFAQMRFISGAGLSTDVGVCVFANTNGGNDMYVLSASHNLGRVQLWRGLDPLVTLTGNIAIVANDVFRVEVSPEVGQNRLKVFINGVQSGADIIDNNVGRPQFGMPGIAYNGTAANATILFDNFSCGIL